MIDWSWSRREKILAGALGGVILLWGVSFWGGSNQVDPLETALQNVEKKESGSTNQIHKDVKSEDVWVDVKGAVHRPGIYKVKSDTRVFQAIEKAGGLLENADTNQMNLASLITDGTVVYVPKKGEAPNQFVGQGEVSSGAASSYSEEKININTATESELQTLQGIGPAKAKAIVQYRTEHGPFPSIDGLKGISGLGEKTISRFKEQITVGK